MKIKFSLIILLLVLPSSNLLAESSAEQQGDIAWARRTEFELSNNVQELTATVKTAIKLYENSLIKFPKNHQVRFKLMQAQYYYGFFLTNDKKEQQILYERNVDLSDETISAIHTQAGIAKDTELTPEALGNKLQNIPNAAKAYFWAAINWGLWGMSHSYFSSAINDVVGKIDWYAKVLLEIDNSYADAGGYRLLGRLYTATPKIPLFTGWIEREKGISYLRKANTYSTKDIRNLVFLADALLKYKKGAKEEAILLLEEACTREPLPENYLEEKFYINQGCALLATAKE